MRTDQRRAENIAPLASWIGANAPTDVLPDQRPLLEVELRGLEPLTFSLRRLRRAGQLGALRAARDALCAC
jgi:hypothetical protein